MPPSTYISIKISGAPLHKAGFIPIINVNGADYDIVDSYPRTLTAERSVVSFSVMSDMTVYRLIFNKIKAKRGTFGSPLVVSFSVPAGYTLPTHTDPCAILTLLLEAFLRQYAEPYTGVGYTGVDDISVNDTFVYYITKIDTGVFEELARAYPLVEAALPDTVMDPCGKRAALITSPADTVRVLANVYDPAFAPYSEILVGRQINNLIVRDTVKTSRPLADDDDTDDDITIAPNKIMTSPPQDVTGDDNPFTPAEDDITTDDDEEEGVQKSTRKKFLLLVIPLLIVIICALCWYTLGDRTPTPTIQTVSPVPTPTDSVAAVPEQPEQPTDTVLAAESQAQEPAPTTTTLPAVAATVTDYADDASAESEPEPEPEPELKLDPRAERPLD